ncbi:ion transporter [Roseobacter sp. N2S]|uniref:ion transporter n=1 Tax=Roseobacter sp. N2S TaxID=2663844 RepID=UPI002856F5A0|nr:ion transporter [Roseobacter sp. N2S]MDR6265567.1 voltage-gated sodium channel [Roseobacter sp. N2S]
MTNAAEPDGVHAPVGHRRKLIAWIETPLVRNTILLVIILNAITLGLATSDRIVQAAGGALALFDDLVVIIFVVEMVLKLYAYGFRFFLSAWNIFDLGIVTISLIPATDSLRVLRGLRVIRAMRVLSAVPQMRDVIKALLDAMPGMGAVVILLSIVFYIFSVMATMLYGATFPQWFGSVGASLYSLFQIMTLESWSMGIVRPVMEVHPYAWAFFVPFIICTAFAVLNLFIGLLVNTMQAAVEEEQDAELERIMGVVSEGNARVQEQLADLQKQLAEISANQESRNG